MTSGGLNIGLIKRLTAYFRNDFRRAFKDIFRFSLPRLGAELQGGLNDLPHQVMENTDAHRGAG